MSMHDDLHSEQPRKQGMSATAKVLLVLGSIAGLCLLACCGFVGFVGFKFKDTIKAVAEATSNDPVVIKQRLEEVIQLDIPAEFTPVATWGLPLGEFSMKQFIYQNKSNPNSVLVIMETNQPMPAGGDAKQQRDAMLQGMRQGQQYGSFDIQEESHETRDFTIEGELVPFEFIKGKAHGVPARKMMGFFPGRKGLIMLILVVAESDYNEEKIVNMIKSIRLPDKAAAAVTEESEQPNDQMPEEADETESEAESSEPASP
jgi:hypothetical protein